VDFASNLLDAKQGKLYASITRVGLDKLLSEYKFREDDRKLTGSCNSVVERRHSIKSVHEKEIKSLDKRLTDLMKKKEKYADLKRQIDALKEVGEEYKMWKACRISRRATL